MGEWDDEPVIAEADFEPDADVFRIWLTEKEQDSTKDGQPVRVKYWEARWDIPRVAWEAGERRKRPAITASSRESRELAEAKCRDKVLAFWMERTDGIRRENYQQQPARLSKEQRAAGYTVQSFLEEWFASKSNPNTAPENRWRPGTERNNQTMLTKWIYPYLGAIPLTKLTHAQVRLHFTETLPSVVDENDQRVLGDKRIRGIYSTFRGGMKRAGAKGLVQAGEFLDVGIRMTFEPAGVPEDIDHLMWEVNALLKRPEVIADPRTLRWALAYGQGLRRGERCGLKWADIDLRAKTITVRRQMSYLPGLPDFLDERLKAGDTRTVPITPITLPHLLAAKERRALVKASPEWKPKNTALEDLLLMRDDGTSERLNHDNTLFHEWMNDYEVSYRNLSPGALRHAAATFWANYGGPDGRGVSRERLREFLGHSAGSDLDAYYARASQRALEREFGGNFYEAETERARERFTGEAANSPLTAEA
jgi:integrase